MSDTSVTFQQQLAAFGTRANQAPRPAAPESANTRRPYGDRIDGYAGDEDGTQNVTLETLSRLAAGLGVHWADLLDDRQTHPPQQHRPVDLLTA